MEEDRQFGRMRILNIRCQHLHDDVIKWKHFPRYWPFVRGIHRWPVNFPYIGQWRGALMFSLICVCNNSWVNNGDAGDLRKHRAHYDVTVMDVNINIFEIISGTFWKILFTFIVHIVSGGLHVLQDIGMSENTDVINRLTSQTDTCQTKS